MVAMTLIEGDGWETLCYGEDDGLLGRDPRRGREGKEKAMLLDKQCLGREFGNATGGTRLAGGQRQGLLMGGWRKQCGGWGRTRRRVKKNGGARPKALPLVQIAVTMEKS